MAFATKYLITFFLLYPSESADWFDVREQRRLTQLDRSALLADAAAKRGHQPHPRFYAMSQMGISCGELGVTSRDKVPPRGILPPLLFQLWISGIAVLIGSWVGRALAKP